MVEEGVIRKGRNRRECLSSWLLFILPMGLFLASLYWQFVLGDSPCPLCIIERCLVLLLALWWSLPLWRIELRQRGFILLIGAGLLLLALGVNLWQLVLQQAPNVPELGGVCVPMISGALPQSSLWGGVLSGAGDCHDAQTYIFGVRSTLWIMFFLGAMLVINVSQGVALWSRRKAP